WLQLRRPPQGRCRAPDRDRRQGTSVDDAVDLRRQEVRHRDLRRRLTPNPPQPLKWRRSWPLCGQDLRHFAGFGPSVRPGRAIPTELLGISGYHAGMTNEDWGFETRQIHAG